MLPFLFWVLSLLAIFVVFRLFDTYRIHTFQAIVINYMVCALTGLAIIGIDPFLAIPMPPPAWFWIAVLIGSFFIATFYVIARSTQIAGIAVTTLASRISFFIPALFSLWIFQASVRPWDTWNYLGILVAVVAVFLAAYRPKVGKLSSSALHLPIGVFLISGGIDTTMNYVSLYHLPEQFEAVFSVLLFGVACSVGAVFLVVRHWQGEHFQRRSWIGGIALGVPNYFSIYLMLVTLRVFEGDGALVFPTFNITVIIFSTLISVVFFREELSRLNHTGIGLAVLAILLISYQQFLNYF